MEQKKKNSLQVVTKWSSPFENIYILASLLKINIYIGTNAHVTGVTTTHGNVKIELEFFKNLQLQSSDGLEIANHHRSTKGLDIATCCRMKFWTIFLGQFGQMFTISNNKSGKLLRRKTENF